MAQLALLGRFGTHWFRQLGTTDEPGTSLVTIGGAARWPGVVEVATGTPIGAVLATTGAVASGWALTGGLAGRWVRLPDVVDVGFSASQLAAVGANRGVGSIVVLPPNGCVLEETVRIVDHLAASGARQCGPCMFGLPAIAADLGALNCGDASALARLQRRLPVINGRGACAHPDGAVMVAASALHVLTTSLGGHLTRHLESGPCHAPAVVPLGTGASR
jgi:NADH:ubiquinone oxidoreductase subunit F (NADH-binding)